MSASGYSIRRSVEAKGSAVRRIARYAGLAAVLLWACAAPAQLFAQKHLDINEIASQLTEITGLKLKKAIPYITINREQLKVFLDRQIREHVKPGEIRAEEITLKVFGLVPRDFDLRKATIELMTEQAAAFYDYRKKRLYLLESTAAGEMQEPALVHEVAHALADQHFHLARYMKGSSQTDDGSLARIAVMEGQATWLMTEYMLRNTGMSLERSPATAEMASRDLETGGAGYPVLDMAPLYLRESMIFPYTAGMRFQQKVVEHSGKAAFAEVFRRPPPSTQQIIHPRLYCDRTAPAARPELPPLPDPRRFKLLTEGGVGEFDHMILLQQYAGKEAAAEIGPHWRGGYYRVWESRKQSHTWTAVHGGVLDGSAEVSAFAPPAERPEGLEPGKHVVLAYAVEWDSPEVAARYLAAYQKALAGKWKTFQVRQPHGDTVVSGRGDDGWFVLRQVGSRISSLEGLPTEEDARAAAGLDWK